MYSGVRWCSSVGMMSSMSLLSVASRAAGLLHDEREWIGLVQQSELAARRLAVRRVGEYAAASRLRWKSATSEPT
jgi:hypothetical protein